MSPLSANVTVDLSGRIGEEEVAAVADQMARRGIARVEGVADVADLSRLMALLGTVRDHPHAQDGVTWVQEQAIASGGVSTRGMTSKGLPPHTDRSSEELPPVLLGFAMLEPAAEGGETTLVDGRAVVERLMQLDFAAFRGLSQPCARFGTDPSEALRPIFDLEGERTFIRYRDDDHLLPGDGVEPWLKPLRECVEEETSRVALAAGEGYVANNGWWLHGREPFHGPRVGVRVLADPHSNWNLKRGFTFLSDDA